jgi:hypothetical protein
MSFGNQHCDFPLDLVGFLAFVVLARAAQLEFKNFNPFMHCSQILVCKYGGV